MCIIVSNLKRAITVTITIKQYTSPTRTENALAYHLPTSACDYHLFLSFPKTGRDWNSLPQKVVQLSIPGAFRSVLQPTPLWPRRCNPVPESSILKLALNRKKKTIINYFRGIFDNFYGADRVRRTVCSCSSTVLLSLTKILYKRVHGKTTIFTDQPLKMIA